MKNCAPLSTWLKTNLELAFASTPVIFSLPVYKFTIIPFALYSRLETVAKKRVLCTPGHLLIQTSVATKRFGDFK